MVDRRGVDVIVAPVVSGLMTLATEKRRVLTVSGAASVEIAAARERGRKFTL